MGKLSYAAGFLRTFVGETTEDAAGHVIGDTFVKICEAFCNCGEQVAKHGGKVAAEAAANAPATVALGTTLLGLPILGPLAVSLGLFGVTVYMKRAREAKEAKERDEAFGKIKEISAAVAALNQQKDDAQENLIALVERKSPVWARISGADQHAFAFRIHREFNEEFEELNQSLDGLHILGSDTNERVRIIEECINKVIQSNGSFVAAIKALRSDLAGRMDWGFGASAERDGQIRADLKAIDAHIHDSGLADAVGRKEFDRLLDQAWDALGGAPNAHDITDFSTANIEKARRALRDARNLRPRDPNIYVVEAVLSFATGSPDAAEKSLREGLRVTPDDWDLQYNLGWMLASQQKYDEAIAAYERAAQLDPKSPHPQYGIAMIFRAQRKPNDAIRYFHSCLALNPADAQAHFFLAHTFIDANDPASAAQEYAEAVKWSPDNAKFRYELAGQYVTQGQLDLARGELEEVVRLSPNAFPNAFVNLGTIYAMDGRLDKAESALRNAVRLDPTNAKAFTNLGNSLSAQGKFQDAIAAYQRSITIEPHAPAYYNLATASDKVGKTKEAIEADRQANALDPNHGLARREVGRRLFEQGQNKDALQQLALAVKVNPDDPYAHNYLGVVLADEKRFEEAIREFREASRLKPDYKEAQSNLDLAVRSQPE
jgi:tetratricopeptide (TPR) repeat protein